MGWVLRIQPNLDGVAVDVEIILLNCELFALGNQDLPLHQIGTGDFFRNSVLHLQSGVHFEEEELLRITVAGHQKLHRSCSDVTDPCCQG